MLGRFERPHTITEHAAHHERVRRLFEALEDYPAVVVATLPIGSLSIAGRMVNTMIVREAPAHGLLVADVRATYRPPYRGKARPTTSIRTPRGYADWTAAFAQALDW